MPEVLSFLVVIVLSAMGLFLLALSQQRHWADVVGPGVLTSLRQRILQTLGIGLLLLSLTAGMLFEGLAFGALLWLLASSSAVLIVTMLLAWRKSSRRRPAPGGDRNRG